MRVTPMLATAGMVTAVGDGWAFELKYDGQRGAAIVDERGARLISRGGGLITSTYPEVAAELRDVLGSRTVALDGEIVALDRNGRPSFSLLQRRMHTPRPTPALVRQVPAALYLFDVLAVDGQPVTGLPYIERRAVLEGLGLDGKQVRVPPAWTTADGIDGAAMLDVARVNGLEGVVAKRLLSRYRAGERSPDWIKQPLRVSASVIIGGWIGGPSRLESLILFAPHPDGGLRHVGQVGTGFSAAARRDLLARLRDIESPAPPDDLPMSEPGAARVRWVWPKLVGDIHYREFNGRLRHASWRGLRTDVGPADAQWPT